MNNLFSEEIQFQLPDIDITHFPNFIDADKATEYFDVFKKNNSLGTR